MWMIRVLSNILFPASCFGCKKKGVALCSRCIGLGRKSLSSVHPFIFSLFDFKDPLIKRLIHAIKYHHRKDLISPLIPYLAETASSVENLSDFTLIPIPMPRLRKLIRGYNQSEILAELISKDLHIPYAGHILIRIKSPQRQATLTERTKRLENQKGAFAVCGNIEGRKFILVDDVTTTGATLIEARNTLLKNGAADVKAVTIAH